MYTFPKIHLKGKPREKYGQRNKLKMSSFFVLMPCKMCLPLHTYLATSLIFFENDAFYGCKIGDKK